MILPTVAKYYRLPITCYLAISIIGLHPLSLPALAQPVPDPVISQLPAPPRTPPPNRTRSGGSLSEENACRQGSEPLVALVPEANPVFTTSTHPTILVYVPYAPEDVEFGEFSVLVGLNETTRLYQTRFALPQTPGIVSISLPASPEYALAEGTPYHWYFKLYCKGNTTAANLEVNAWVQRIAPTADTDRQIDAATPEIWYDALAQVFDRLQVAPQDGELRDRWYSLLELIESENLAEKPLVGAVQILE